MHQAFGIEVRVVMVNLSEQLLDANILLLLYSSLDVSRMVLEVDLDNLVGNRELACASWRRTMLIKWLRTSV